VGVRPPRAQSQPAEADRRGTRRPSARCPGSHVAGRSSCRGRSARAAPPRPGRRSRPQTRWHPQRSRSVAGPNRPKRPTPRGPFPPAGPRGPGGTRARRRAPPRARLPEIAGSGLRFPA
jgi:hypothetical protein